MKHALLSATSLATATCTPSMVKPGLGSMWRGFAALSLASAIVPLAPGDAGAIAIYSVAATGPAETATPFNSSNTITYTDAVGNTNSTASVNYTLVGTTASRSYTVARRSATSGTTTFTYTATTPGQFSSTISGTTLSGSGATRTITTTVAPTTRTGGSITGTFTLTGTNPNSTNFSNSSVDYTANTAQTTVMTFQTTPVAPVASVASTVTFGSARVGSSNTATLSVKNTGDGNKAGADNGTTFLSNLRGTVGAASGAISGAGGAVNLGDSASTTFTFKYAPTTRGANSTIVSTALTTGVGNTNASGTATTTLSGTGVSPIYNAGVGTIGNTIVNGGTIRFGDIAGGVTLQDLLINNVTPDAGGRALTDLTITNAAFVNPSTDFSFSLSGFDTPVAGASGSLRSAANTQNLGKIAIQFGTKAGNTYATAQLRIQTDENAALGGAGTVYVYNLVGTVPEPGTLMVLGTGLLGLAVSRYRRGRRAPAALTAGDLQS